MVVNTNEASPSRSDSGTDLSPTPQPIHSTEQDHELQILHSDDPNTEPLPAARPTDLEQGHQRHDLPSGVPSNFDATLNCPDTNANDIKENTADLSGTKKEEAKAPQSRKERLRKLHITTQRLTIAENSCKDIENRVSLLWQSVETLKSISQSNGHGSERGLDHQDGPDSDSIRNHILPTTLDREQQILESIRLSCQHSQQWTRCYKERINIQIQLVTHSFTESWIALTSS